MKSAFSKFLAVNGVRYHYLDYGNPRKPSLVCLHGLTRNAEDFAPVVALLRERFHIRAIDVRGRGESGWGAPDRYGFTQYVEDLVTLLDAWKTEKTSLLGTSMGGIVSMIFAAKFPHRLDRLVLNDIGPEIDPRGAQRILRTTTQAPAEFRERAEAIAYFRVYFPTVEGFTDEKLWSFAQSSLQPNGTGGWRWKLDPAVREALLRPGNGQTSPDLWAEFMGVKCPLLVIRGSSSDVLSRQTCLRMKEAQPEARFAEVPGVGHTPLLSEPAATEALELFLVGRADGERG